jgi:hypothetical protein
MVMNEVPDHVELAAERIGDDASLMAWLVTLADGEQAVEVGNWRKPADFDPVEPALIGPSAPLRFTIPSLPEALALVREAVAKLPANGQLPASMPRNSCGMLAHKAPVQILACRGPDGADLAVIALDDGTATAHAPLAKAQALVRILEATCAALSSPGSSRVH